MQRQGRKHTRAPAHHPGGRGAGGGTSIPTLASLCNTQNNQQPAVGQSSPKREVVNFAGGDVWPPCTCLGFLLLFIVTAACPLLCCVSVVAWWDPLTSSGGAACSKKHQSYRNIIIRTQHVLQRDLMDTPASADMQHGSTSQTLQATHTVSSKAR